MVGVVVVVGDVDFDVDFVVVGLFCCESCWCVVSGGEMSGLGLGLEKAVSGGGVNGTAAEAVVGVCGNALGLEFWR